MGRRRRLWCFGRHTQRCQRVLADTTFESDYAYLYKDILLKKTALSTVSVFVILSCMEPLLVMSLSLSLSLSPHTHNIYIYVLLSMCEALEMDEIR